MDRRRKLTQIFISLLYNANLKGFLNGKIYQGRLKSFCVPGLNCYSCPGALGSCPLGSLQSQFGSSPVMLPLYVSGLLILFGTLVGRFICGWLCPFGLFQELLYIIPLKKTSIKNKYLPYLKYFFLFVLAIAIPAVTVKTSGFAVPAFCKYICPAGTIFAGFPLLLSNESLRGAAKFLFLSKTIISVIIILLAIKIFRPFCKYICPLGAIYGFFNKISIVRIDYFADRCMNCKNCRASCRMNISVDLNTNSPECIRCGRCVTACRSKALKFSIHIPCRTHRG